MADVILFIEPHCAFCNAARRYLRAKGVAVTEIDVGDPTARRVLQRLTGSATVPQIFISDVHVGGYEELRRMDVLGELDQLLTSAPKPRIETTLSLSI
ncbi:MAG: glutaredoxin 3 [Proteobacteria bacterium]|nr:glutaredoxin 3 [Pseudomonadota bacterium]